jgi:hypothetical protein
MRVVPHKLPGFKKRYSWRMKERSGEGMVLLVLNPMYQDIGGKFSRIEFKRLQLFF